MKKKYIYIIVALFLICSIPLISYAGGIYWIKKIGINIKPSNSFKPINVQYYLQNDSNWGNDKIGSTGYRLSSSGCLIACLSSSLNNFNINLSPKDLNKLFSSIGVYNSNGEVIWHKINSTLKTIGYDYKRIFFSNTLHADLERGELPILKVKYYKTGVYHWVLVVGATENDFLIMDPLEQNKKLVPLSRHGKVFAYRRLLKIL